MSLLYIILIFYFQFSTQTRQLYSQHFVFEFFIFRLNKSFLSWVTISAADNPLVKSGGSAIVRSANGNIRSYNDMTNAAEENAKRTEEASQILLQSQIVCFDVDSTVIQEEGIDELASFCGKGAEVSRL